MGVGPASPKLIDVCALSPSHNAILLNFSKCHSGQGEGDISLPDFLSNLCHLLWGNESQAESDFALPMQCCPEAMNLERPDLGGKGKREGDNVGTEANLSQSFPAQPKDSQTHNMVTTRPLWSMPVANLVNFIL